MAVPKGLIGRMTLAEKIGQLTMMTANFVVTGPVVEADVEAGVRAGRFGLLFNLYGRAAVRAAQRVAVEESRLGVPILSAFDVVHGFRTVFPIPLGEAGAFDPDLWRATARAAAVESAAEGLDLTFAPMLDLCRDPRWGRIAEGPGEDPFVGSAFAEAKVRGFREGPPTAALAVTPKHFAAYGASLAGRDYAPTEVSARTLAELYLPPFRAAVAAGAEAVMPAFTDVEGVPATASGALIDGLLRRAWGFGGVVISDYTAIQELIVHGVAADKAEAAALALRAGVDVDMMSFAYEEGLPVALDRGLIVEAEIDAAVARVLALKDRLGLFDDPYLRCGPPGEAADAVDLAGPRAAARTLARAAAGRSLVLLQNRGGLLPFDAPPDRLALIGPLADAPAEMLGPWAGAGRGDEAVGVLGGLRDLWPQVAVDFAPGVPIEGGADAGIAAAVAAARRADQVVLCLGEAAWMSGEAASRARLDLPGRQAELAAAVLAVGRPTVVLLFSGRPIAMPEVFAAADAVVACWFPGSEAGHAVADLISGRISPSARLPVTWPRHVGQVPIFFGARSGGRPEAAGNKYTSKYLDLPNAPQFPFGHGLGYGRLTLGAPDVVATEDGLAVTAEVSNRGLRADAGPVFLFVHDPVASIARPTLELRGLARVALGPGRRTQVAFRLARADLGFLDADLRPTFEPGAFVISVGLSADPEALRSVEVRLD